MFENDRNLFPEHYNTNELTEIHDTRSSGAQRSACFMMSTVHQPNDVVITSSMLSLSIKQAGSTCL